MLAGNMAFLEIDFAYHHGQRHVSQQVRPRVNGIQHLRIRSPADGRLDLTRPARRAKEIRNLAVDAPRLRFETRTDHDGNIGKRTVHNTALRSHATSAKTRHLVKDGALGKLASIAGLVPVGHDALEVAFAEERLEGLEVVAMIRQELARRVDLQSVNLVERNQLVPAGFCPWKPVEFLRRAHDTLDGVEISFLVRVCNVMPRRELAESCSGRAKH